MAFDGVTIASIVQELNDKLLDGRIYKIAQPEKDELLLTIKSAGQQYRLMMSADASLPLIYLTQENKKSPLTAPNFCMLLRKHLQNGRIVGISQPGLERVIQFEVEHLDEMGDLCRKTLAMELMGKHSNIIFYDEQKKILDSIKHVSGMVSSVREVLPGRIYFIPETENKHDFAQNPDIVSQFSYVITSKAMPVYKSIYNSYVGISPILAQEICYRAGVDADAPANALSETQQESLQRTFEAFAESVRGRDFSPCIIYDVQETPIEFGVLPFRIYEDNRKVTYESISEVLHEYYAQRSAKTRIRQKSADLHRIVSTALERNVKKYDIQCRQLKDTEKREKYKVYGELLHTYGYSAEPQAKNITVMNYYTNEELTIPLDPELTAMENAAKYFDKYGKMKRTYEALTEFVKETKAEIDHLESVMNALDIAEKEEDLLQIKEELIQSGYIRYKGSRKKAKITSRPFHFVSSDGYDMYVGRNNLQNDEITFQLAQGNDWWFHAKGAPGSHVVVKSGGKEMPDRTFEEAGRLAAHFSKAKDQDKVEIDYVERKHVKKPGGAKPGFVVYYTNYSMVIDADISGIRQIDDGNNN
ncbi:MAG: fibronectin/fibrinogen-binding protein [Lachnospiraceae bacterium]|nr:fibronectin/fibrinogen-binding protein [Lachnospiraceae bacterium]